MLVRGRQNQTLNVLMYRAVEVVVIGILSYIGFLADIKQSIVETQQSMKSLSAKQYECEVGVDAMRRELEAHRQQERGGERSH